MRLGAGDELLVICRSEDGHGLEMAARQGHADQVLGGEGHPPGTAAQLKADPGCPECGSEAERLISGGAGLLFKGSGFYITDYRSESYKKAAAREKPSSAADADKGKAEEAKAGKGKATKKTGVPGKGKSGSKGSE